MDSTRKIKDKCEKFRILVIGRGNAGKTTILQRVCNTTEQPKVYDASGQILPFTPKGSAMRGEHDIENEMVFESNPGFIFHDSRGFESGGTLELDKVKAFITERSQHTRLAQRLHAIWYCIPVNESRPFTAAEDWFFSECASDSVPVIAIFTKFDALDDEAFSALRKENLSRAEARSGAASRAINDFKKQHSDLFYAKSCRPKGQAFLRNMHEDGDCSELVEQTAAAFDDEILQQLFVSTQWNNLELCTKYSLGNVLMPSITGEIKKGTWSSLFGDSLRRKEANRIAVELARWFPQFVREHFPLHWTYIDAAHNWDNFNCRA